MDPRDKWALLHRLEGQVEHLRRELGLPPERIAVGLSRRERLVLEAERVAHLGSWTWNLQTNEIAWSDELYRILGYERATVSPSSEAFYEAIHPDDREHVREVTTDSLRSGVVEPVSFRLLRPSGELRRVWMEAAFLDSGEARSHVVGTVLDETDKQRSEERLARMLADLSEAQRIAALGSWRWSVDGGSEWSEGMYRLLGLDDTAVPSEELWYRHIHPDDVERARAAADQAIRTETASPLEVRMLRTDGAVRDVLLYSRAELDERGKLCAFRGVLMDITERKALEATVRHAQKMEAIGTLAGGVAHDFNNYLLVIGGHSELLEGMLPEGHAARPSLAAIRFAYERCVNLTEQLLTLSRRRPTEPRPFDLAERIEGLAPMLRSVLGETIELRLELDHCASQVEADPAHVEHVLVNLALNARDAMGGGGVLTMRLGAAHVQRREVSDLEPGAYVRLSVQDTGSGIEPEILGRIFEPFFTTKPTGKGTGLGLAVVYGTMREAGGAIEVESRRGQGTTFHLYFRPAALPAARESAQSEHDDQAGHGLRVLLVEDVPPLRELVKTQLERAGYEVREAADGLAALALLETWVPDLLVSDVVMPNLGGVELVRAARAKLPALRCLLMSAYTASRVSDARLDPPVPLLRKPFAESELLAALAALRPREAAL